MHGESLPGQPKPGLRARLYRQLEPAAWERKGLSPANRVVTYLILLSVVLAIIDTERTIQARHGGLIFGIELVIFTVFAAEYFARLYAAGEDARYRGLGGRLRYVFSVWALIDLLALLPFLLSFGGNNSVAFRVIRVLRMLRIAKLGRMTTAWDLLAESVWSRRFELWITTLVAGMLLLVSSTLLYLIEGDLQPEAFGSIPRALWWSVSTLTTVGYGDVTPVTALGKFSAGLTALAGIGMIAMPAGILAGAFSDVVQKQKARME